MIASMNAVDVALLKSEWCRDGFCPSCGGDGRFDNAKHRPGCLHDQGLSERGYPTQVERDAARARIDAADAGTLPPPQ